MLTKLAILILLPVGTDEKTATEFVGRWQPNPQATEKVAGVEFRVPNEKPTKEEMQTHLLSFGTVLLVDQLVSDKGYMVAYVVKSAEDLGPGRGNKSLVDYWLQKDEFPLVLKFDSEASIRFARSKEHAQKPMDGKAAAVEHIRVTKAQLEQGTVAGLKYVAPDGPKSDGVRGAINYLGGEGWDVVFDGEVIVGKRHPANPTRWEFQIVERDPERPAAFDELLTTAGREGWELTGIYDGNRKAVFKRPLAAEKKADSKAEPKKEEPSRVEFPSKPVIK